MAKNSIREYSTTESNNTDIAGIGILGTSAVSNFDGALRTLMKQLADMNAGTSPINDTFALCDPADATKKVRIDAGTVAAGQTRVLTMPNFDITLATAAQQPYEKGTWTPAIGFNGVSTGITYSSRAGYYIRIGRLIYVFAEMNLTSKGAAAGTAWIGGLPFVSSNWVQPASISAYANMVGITGNFAGQVRGDFAIDLTHGGTTDVSLLTNANFTNTSFLRVSATYFGAAGDV